MAELNEIQFLLFVLLMIFPAYALDVFFMRAHDEFKHKSEIIIDIKNGEKTYGGTLNQLIYEPKNDTSKVIVYIINRSRFVEIVRNAVREERLQIAQELSEWHYELLFLGIENFDDDEYHLISAFMLDKIRSQRGWTNFTVEAIGEDGFDRVCPCYSMNFEKYEETAQICGGDLRARLRSISHGALKPVESDDKEIRLYGFHPAVPEVRWPVSVVNETYSLRVDVKIPKYNFRIRYKTKKICLLILSGKEYLAVTSLYYRKRSAKEGAIARTMDMMTRNNEGLFILGVFHFDWTEIYIVTQIILAHSVGWQGFDYNVFTYGYGMFNTIYLNMDAADGRYIFQQPKSSVTELIKKLMGKEVKKRSLKMYYSDEDGWKFLEMPIISSNGQYLAAREFEDLTFPWVNQNIVFIVYDSTETNDSIYLPMVYQSVEELKRSGIFVVFIKAVNFGLGDIYIIAQWIDCHRKLVIYSEQIAVLGAGIFDTIFQSKTTTYKTLLNTKKNELKNIRNTFVNDGIGKRVFAARINNPKFKVWTYLMNTINGFHEPDMIPDKNMFGTTGRKNIFFIITSANCFYQAASSVNVELRTVLREKIEVHFPCSDWRLFLVGLDNFEERDYHLFAELVKRQTNDERPLAEFVLTFNYGFDCPMYQYKDTPPIHVANSSYIKLNVKSFFERACKLPDGTPLH